MKYIATFVINLKPFTPLSITREYNLIRSNNLSENGDTALLYSYKFSNGNHFPKSYTDFVEKYGYGLSANMFIIYIPMENYPDSFFVRSKEIISTYSDVLENESELWFDLEPDISYNKLKDLIPFACSENGHYLFWDIESQNINEFDIYITDFRNIGFVKVAENLYDFFDLVTTEKYKTVFPYQTSYLPKTFEPIKRII